MRLSTLVTTSARHTWRTIPAWVAAVVVAVVAIVALLGQTGFGVAAALLIDATIIRSVVLLGAMKLLGNWNWYFPRWLEWPPRLQVEGSDSMRGAHSVLEQAVTSSTSPSVT